LPAKLAHPYTKTTLRKVLGKALATLPVLQTGIVEIEAVLNNRPLTYVSADLKDPDPLTPSHLLCGQHITSMPQAITNDDKSDPTFEVPPIRQMAKHQNQLIQHFEARWTGEYLTSLHEYHKTTGTTKQQVQVEDVPVQCSYCPQRRSKI